MPLPRQVAALMAIWKWYYYAPNTLKEMYDAQIQRGTEPALPLLPSRSRTRGAARRRWLAFRPAWQPSGPLR